MRIQLASDLHLERLQRYFPGERLISPAPGADVLVLAGDIANGSLAISLFKDWPVPVLYVAGNHEFYHESFDQMRSDLRAAAAGTAVTFLDNEAVEIGGVRFLGATLWTDYRYSMQHSPQQSMEFSEANIYDHQAILTQEGAFTAARALDEHTLSRAWLERELARPYAGKTVVVTHHGPHARSVHNRYLGMQINAAFVSHLENMVVQADFWFHGHVHDFFDYRIGKCRVVVNPRGYALAMNQVNAVDLPFENPAFNWSCVIDTDEPAPLATGEQSATGIPDAGSGWVCRSCADERLGPPVTRTQTVHSGRCDFCHRTRGVMPIDDFSSRVALS
jgi:predicted phosphodiesterase